MTGWVTDKGLDRLLAQINEAAPNRSKASDGSVGDLDHQTRVSHHNPESPPPEGNPDNQVDARDFTHDPANNADMAIVSEAIRQSRDRRVSYVIFNARIFSSYAKNDRKAWEWGPYTGINLHRKHMHVSVNDEHHDETQDWKIGIDVWTVGDIKALKNRVDAIIDMDPINPVGDDLKPEPNNLASAIRAIATEVDAIRVGVAALAEKMEGGGEPLEIVLGTEQLGQLADLVVARLGVLRFEAHE
jgi:hypothetical protein